MKRFHDKQKIRVSNPDNTQREPLRGMTGTVWRLRRADDLAWVQMDADLPEGFAVFPSDDERRNHIMMAPEECEEYRNETSVEETKMTPRIFAIAAHGDQHYGDSPYCIHLQAVHDVLVEFGFIDEDLLAAAWLHDVIEDTSYTWDDIKGEFGLRVANIVAGVTDEPGRNRKERHRLTYPKIAADVNAITLKLADRIANMRAALKAKPRLFEMYQKEYPDFRHALIGNGGSKEMWAELDRLYADVSL